MASCSPFKGIYAGCTTPKAPFSPSDRRVEMTSGKSDNPTTPSSPFLEGPCVQSTSKRWAAMLTVRKALPSFQITLYCPSLQLLRRYEQVRPHTEHRDATFEP